jgi:serine/threonine protein kinase
MEYVDVRTLEELLPKAGLPMKRLLALARQIVDAVIAAHERGIVHRDLKPANVMVPAADRVKVLDFGLAKLREAATPAIEASMPTRELTGEGRIVGTVAYMSPEQAQGNAVNERSDQSTKDLRNDLEELDQSLSSGELDAAPLDTRRRGGMWQPIVATLVLIAGVAAATMWLRVFKVWTSAARPSRSCARAAMVFCAAGPP